MLPSILRSMLPSMPSLYAVSLCLSLCLSIRPLPEWGIVGPSRPPPAPVPPPAAAVPPPAALAAPPAAVPTTAALRRQLLERGRHLLLCLPHDFDQLLATTVYPPVYPSVYPSVCVKGTVSAMVSEKCGKLQCEYGHVSPDQGRVGSYSSTSSYILRATNTLNVCYLHTRVITFTKLDTKWTSCE